MLIRSLKWQPVLKSNYFNRVLTNNIAYHRFFFPSSGLISNISRSICLINKIVLRHLTDTKDEKLWRSDEIYPIEVEKQMDLERIREMQKYFEQYTEEYVEMEVEPETACEIMTKSGMYYLFFIQNSIRVNIINDSAFVYCNCIFSFTSDSTTTKF